MRKLLFVVALTLVGGGLGAPAAAAGARPDVDSVRVWNELALTAVRTTRATDTDGNPSTRPDPAWTAASPPAAH